jgi:ADP-ribose pyrophosphatase YjhB (NUDIX family)
LKKSEMKYCTKCGNILEVKVIHNKERIYCKYCNTVFYNNPLPTVAIVAQNDRGDLLLVKRGVEPKKGFWALPGGFMDSNESAEKAALREMFEETGLKGKIDRFIKVYNHNSKMYGEVIIITYKVKIIGGNLRAGDDAEQAKFFDVNQLPALAFSFQEDAVEQVTGILL